MNKSICKFFNYHMYIYADIFIHVLAYTYTCIYIYMHIHVHAYTYTCINRYMHIHIHACAHIFTHIHAYTYPGGMDNAAFIVDSIYICIYI
jgi:hypothetical protein